MLRQTGFRSPDAARRLPLRRSRPYTAYVTIAVFLTFLLGIANFAMHKAMLESRHPLLGQMAWFFRMMGGRFSLAVEFFMLLGALLFVAGGSTGWALGYGAYSMLNGLSAWLIVSGRV